MIYLSRNPIEITKYTVTHIISYDHGILLFFRYCQTEIWISSHSGRKTTIKRFTLKPIDAWQKTPLEKSSREMSTLELVGQDIQ